MCELDVWQDCYAKDGLQNARAGPVNLNIPISVQTAPAGEDLACEDWSKDEQKTPLHALSDILGPCVALAAVRGDKTQCQLAQQHDVHPNQITDWKNQLLTRAADVLGDEQATAESAIDLKALHAKIGQLALENNFLEGALIKAGMLSAKR